MIIISDDKKTLLGPAIVAGANSMRAFDAPIRYPLTLSRWDYSGTLSNALRLSSFSSFIVLVEHIIGMVILAPFLLYKKGFTHFRSLITSFDRKEKLSLLGVSLGSGLGLYFFLIAFGMGNPTVAIVIQKTQPIITLLVAMLFLNERPSRNFYIAAILSVLGIVLLSFDDFTDPTPFELYAALASLAAAALWASNTVWGKTLTDKVDYWDLTWLRYIGGALILAVFNLITWSYTKDNYSGLSQTFNTFGLMGPGPAPLAMNIEMTGILIIFLATIFTGGIIPLAIYYYGLKSSKAAIGGLAELAFPMLAIFVNYLFIGFTLSIFQIIGAVIILVSTSWLTIINRKEHEKEASS